MASYPDTVLEFRIVFAVITSGCLEQAFWRFLTTDFRVYLFHNRMNFNLGGLHVEGYFATYADLNVNVQTLCQGISLRGEDKVTNRTLLDSSYVVVQG